MKLALKWFLPITLVAMGLAWGSEQIALLLGFDPPPQDLRFLQEAVYHL